MNRVLQLALVVTVASVAAVTVGSAQGARFGLGGGLLSPLGDYKNLDKTGWHGLVRVDLSIPMSPVGIRVDGLYGQTSHKAPSTATATARGLADWQAWCGTSRCRLPWSSRTCWRAGAFST